MKPISILSLLGIKEIEFAGLEYINIAISISQTRNKMGQIPIYA